MKLEEMNRHLVGAAACTLGALAVVGLLLAGCAPVPKDDADAKLMHFESTRAQRYTEIFAIYGDAITKNLKAGVYNTLGLNGASPTGAGDSTPQALLDKVTPELVKKETGAVSAFINGPRVWTLDWIEVDVGKERDFGGLKARWVTWFPIPKDMDLQKKGSTYYKPVQVERHTKFGFNKDKPVFILDAPNGDTFVMKSLSLEQDKTQTYDSLTSLGSRLKLPEGWKFRVAMLDKDLVLTPDNGVAWIVQDDLLNTYDRAGGAYSNFRP